MPIAMCLPRLRGPDFVPGAPPDASLRCAVLTRQPPGASNATQLRLSPAPCAGAPGSISAALPACCQLPRRPLRWRTNSAPSWLGNAPTIVRTLRASEAYLDGAVQELRALDADAEMGAASDAAAPAVAPLACF